MDVHATIRTDDGQLLHLVGLGRKDCADELRDPYVAALDKPSTMHDQLRILHHELDTRQARTTAEFGRLWWLIRRILQALMSGLAEPPRGDAKWEQPSVEPNDYAVPTRRLTGKAKD